MNMKECFLRLATLLILLFSARAYAIPILQVNVAGPSGEIYFSEYNDGGLSHPEADEVLIPMYPLWNGHIDRNNPLSDTYPDVFTLLYGFNTGFVTQFPGSDPAYFVIPGSVKEINGSIGSSGDADDVAGFFATLGIAMADWQVTEENPQAVSPQDLVPATPAITRQGQRNECLQPRYEHSQKSGSRESLCAAGGDGGTGAGGGVGRRGGGSAVTGRASGGPGAGGGSGTGTGGPGTGGGPGIGGDSGSGTSGTGGSGPGAGIGNGHGGDSGSGGIGEVRTVSEPATLALIGFGIATLCVVRRCKK